MTKRSFNMIELLLALGVIAIGVVSVLALFPVGLSNTRDAMAETYAANAAEQLLHSIRYTVEQNWSSWVRPASMGGTWDNKLDLGTEASPGPDIGLVSVDPSIQGGGVFSSNGTILEQTPQKVYKLVAFADADDDQSFDGPPDELPDFQCVAVVWGEQIELDGGSLVNWSVGSQINVEVSWPAELPYWRRTKRIYSLEVFNVDN